LMDNFDRAHLVHEKHERHKKNEYVFCRATTGYALYSTALHEIRTLTMIKKFFVLFVFFVDKFNGNKQTIRQVWLNHLAK